MNKYMPGLSIPQIKRLEITECKERLSKYNLEPEDMDAVCSLLENAYKVIEENCNFNKSLTAFIEKECGTDWNERFYNEYLRKETVSSKDIKLDFMEEIFSDDDILQYADEICAVKLAPHQYSGNPYWKISERALIITAISYFSYYYDNTEETLENLFLAMDDILSFCTSRNSANRFASIINSDNNLSSNDLICQQYRLFKRFASNQVREIIDSAKQRIKVYALYHQK